MHWFIVEVPLYQTAIGLDFIIVGSIDAYSSLIVFNDFTKNVNNCLYYIKSYLVKYQEFLEMRVREYLE